MALGLDSLMGSIYSLSHTRRTIDGSMNEYPVAPVSNKAVVLILLLFPNIHGATKAFSANKLPGRLDDDTINGFSPLLTTSAEVSRFPPVALVPPAPPCG